MLFCKIKMTEIEEVIWRWILKTGFKTQTEISKNSYLTVNLLKGSRNQRISDAFYGSESSAVLLDPLAWKMGPARVIKSERLNTRPTRSISFTERGIYFSMRTCCSSAISASLLSLVAIYKYSWRICLYAILRITRYPGLWPVKLFIIRCLQHSINTVRSWEKLLSTLLDRRL